MRRIFDRKRLPTSLRITLRDLLALTRILIEQQFLREQLGQLLYSGRYDSTSFITTPCTSVSRMSRPLKR